MKAQEYWICDLELSEKKTETYVLNEAPIKPSSFLRVYHVVEKQGFDEMLEKALAVVKALDEVWEAEGLSDSQLASLKAWQSFAKDRLNG